MQNKAIYILTRGRVGNQLTLENIKKHAPRWSQHVWLVHPDNEHHDWPRCITYDLADIPNLSVKRDFVVDIGARYQIQMDDDLRDFRVRPYDGVNDFQDYIVGTQMDDIFDLLFNKLKEYAHVGMSQRAGNNRVEKDHQICARMCDVLGYDADVIKKYRLKFGDMILMQDFHMTLSLIERGHPNWITYKYSCGQKVTATIVGGCAAYRTQELMFEQSTRLAQLHAPFVRLIKKAPKTWNMGEFQDVRVSWKKALGSKVQ